MNKDDTRYGASKRLCEDMEKADRDFFITLAGLGCLTITALGLVGYVFWRFVL